jgi:hypothetical protein
LVPELQYVHYWVKRPRATCAWCLYESRCQKVLGKEDKNKAKGHWQDARSVKWHFVQRGSVGASIIQIMLITLNLLYNMHLNNASN